MSNNTFVGGFGELSGAVFSVASENHPDRNEDTAFLDIQSASLGVFDGMGDSEHPEIAAQVARDTTREVLSQQPLFAEVSEAREVVHGALQKAASEVVRQCAGNITTGTAMKLFVSRVGERYAAIASSGDSRAYLLRQGKLHFLTIDNAILVHDEISRERRFQQQMRLAAVMKKTELDDDDLHAFHNRNIIYSGLGQFPLHISTGHLSVEKGDRFLLTTDGIHDNLVTKEIESKASRAWSDEEVARRLVEASRARSNEWQYTDRAKKDDMTAVVMTVQE